MKKRILMLALQLLMVAGLFSQNRIESDLKKHVDALVADSLLGRAAGTRGEKIAAKYIEDLFKLNDIELLYPHPGQDFSFVNSSGDTLNSQNIVAIVEGYDPKLKNEFILVGAHYDHLGHNLFTVNGRDSIQIYRGADDNASGVAVMLEVAKMVRARNFMFKRSVIFAAFGAEEEGMIGSWYFVNRAFAHKDKISLMINLDMVGRGSDGRAMTIYTLLPHPELITLINDVSDRPLMPTLKAKPSGYFPSDHQPFAVEGIPIALFTTGLHRDYHSIRDVESELDYSTMGATTEFVYNLALEAANMKRMLPKTSFAPLEEPTDPLMAEPLYKQNKVEKPALFLHGSEQRFLDRWVYRYIKYPKEAIADGVSGRVIVEFTVDHKGKVKDVEVVKSVDPYLDREAIKVVEASPDWRPARVGGKPVSVRITLPIEFRLKR